MRIAFFNDTSRDNHHGCSIVVSEIERRLSDIGASIVWRHHVADNWRDGLPIPTVDLVMVNGEGSIHHTGGPWRRAATLCEVGPYARDHLKVPSHLINAGIEAIDSASAENLKAFSRIFVRDTYSQDCLMSFGVKSSVVPDLTVCRSYTAGGKRPGVLATDSVIDAVRDAIFERATLDAWSYEPIVFPQSSASVDPLPFVKRLSSADLVVTGRFHVAALCLATRTPVVAVESRTPKIGGLFTDAFGSKRRIIQKEEISSFSTSTFDTWTTDEEDALNKFLNASQLGAIQMFVAAKNCRKRRNLLNRLFCKETL